MIPTGHIVQALARAFFQESKARMVLAWMDYPDTHIPQWHSAAEFWTAIVQSLNAGLVENGIARLITWAAREMPGAPDLQELAKQLREDSGPIAEPLAAPASPMLTEDGGYATVVLAGSDQHGTFYRLVQAEFGEQQVELVYGSRRQAAVQVPPQDDDGEALIARLRQPVRSACGDDAELRYEETAFRPYLYRQLLVIGPDGTPYHLNFVPATTQAEEIAGAIIQQTPAAMTDNLGRRVRTTVDLVPEDGSEPQRLEGQQSLHEAGVRDEDRLQVGAEAVAGAVSPVLHVDAVHRARAQIKRFAVANRDIGFKVLKADPPDVPLNYLIEFEVPGFAPPADRTADAPEPPAIGLHQVNLVLGRDFPIIAPLAIFATPVFHPNIWYSDRTGAVPGMACLGQLMDGWRPDLTFGLLCRLIVDIACYRNYDVTEATTFPDPYAARWARSEAGQARIAEIGGRRITEQPKAPDADAPVDMWAQSLWVERAGETGK